MPSARAIPLRAVLFDLDGTLVETYIDFSGMAAAMRALTAEAGVPRAAIEGKDILSTVEAAADYLSQRGGDGGALRRTAFRQLEEMEVAGCAHPTLLPGARELLMHLHAENLRIGIVTRNCRRVSCGLLARYALPHDSLMSRDDVRLAKPHPEHLWDILRTLDTRPAEAAMVGDHRMDIEASHAAGCAMSIGILGAHPADWFASCRPTHVVRDLRDAWALFQTGGRDT